MHLPVAEFVNKYGALAAMPQQVQMRALLALPEAKAGDNQALEAEETKVSSPWTQTPSLARSFLGLLCVAAPRLLSYRCLNLCPGAFADQGDRVRDSESVGAAR